MGFQPNDPRLSLDRVRDLRILLAKREDYVRRGLTERARGVGAAVAVLWAEWMSEPYDSGLGDLYEF